MAGAVNSVLASPVEMFKVRMQAQYGKPNDLRSGRKAPHSKGKRKLKVFNLRLDYEKQSA
jgi:hypothetical protein